MTARTPFLLGDVVDFPGERPTIYARSSNRFWLGRPGNMIELPAPSAAFTKTPTQSETAHTLLSGGVAITRALSLKYQWDLAWPQLSQRDWAVIDAFYRRLFGNGPWCLVSPEEVNYLTEAGSIGAPGNPSPTSNVIGWETTSSGVVGADPTIVIAPATFMEWGFLASGDVLVYGVIDPDFNNPAPDPAVAPAYVPAEPVTFSIYARPQSGSADAEVVMGLASSDAGGSVDGSVSASPVTLTGADFVRLTVTAAPGDLGAAAYILPTITCNTDGVIVELTAPQLEYAPAASDWTTGTGAPRVLIPAGPVRAVNALLKTAPTMTLVESGNFPALPSGNN